MLGFGVFALVVEAIQQTPTGAAFNWTRKSLAAFLAGAALGWAYWLVIGRMVASDAGDEPSRRRRFLTLSLPLVAVALGVYLVFPFKLTAGEKLRDIIVGLILATLALGVVGFAMWRVIKFLNEDNENPNPPPSAPSTRDDP